VGHPRPLSSSQDSTQASIYRRDDLIFSRSQPSLGTILYRDILGFQSGKFSDSRFKLFPESAFHRVSDVMILGVACAATAEEILWHEM
jgi:hypothetical protein